MTYAERLAEIRRFRALDMHQLADNRADLLARDVLVDIASHGHVIAAQAVEAYQR